MSFRPSTQLPILAFLSLLVVISGCSCPNLTFQEIYEDTPVIVRARVVRVRNIPPEESSFNAEEIRYKLKTLHVLKGCSPGKVFRARTVLDGGICSSVLKKGDVVRVNLPTPKKRTYDFFGCYTTQVWGEIQREERRFLWRLRRMNDCEA